MLKKEDDEINENVYEHDSFPSEREIIKSLIKQTRYCVFNTDGSMDRR